MNNSAVNVKSYFGLGSGYVGNKGVQIISTKLIKKGKEKGFGNAK